MLVFFAEITRCLCAPNSFYVLLQSSFLELLSFKILVLEYLGFHIYLIHLHTMLPVWWSWGKFFFVSCELRNPQSHSFRTRPPLFSVCDWVKQDHTARTERSCTSQQMHISEPGCDKWSRSLGYPQTPKSGALRGMRQWGSLRVVHTVAR